MALILPLMFFQVTFSRSGTRESFNTARSATSGFPWEAIVTSVKMTLLTPVFLSFFCIF